MTQAASDLYQPGFGIDGGGFAAIARVDGFLKQMSPGARVRV